MKIIEWTNEGYKDVEINENDIASFTKTNTKQWTRKGGFKKWFPKYYIRMVDGTMIRTEEFTYKDLVALFKGKVNPDKSYNIEYKGYKEHKAIDYSWIVKA